MVLSGKKAIINQGSNLSVEQTTVVNNVPTLQTVFIPYNTSLDVTPRATNEGSVFMKLNFQRDVVQIDANNKNSVAPRNVTTEVVVENGNTLVLGGVQNLSEASGTRGFPFLRKIPILGWLFGTESKVEEKSELMFFVTPKIVNVRKTALGSGSDSDAEQKSEKL
jgi:type IV pilus assembly protein PilQ